MNLAPNGRESNLTPEQYSLVRTPAFKKWFGDWENDPTNASKVVDENGEPLVVYHGTDKEFNVFDKTKSGELETIEGVDRKIGIYFTNKKSVASFFTKNKGKISNYFVVIKNPFKTKIRELSTFNIKFNRELGSDGVIWNRGSGVYVNGKEYPLQKGEIAEIEYIAFEPNQIKLADGSNTTFDGSNPDIRYADGGIIPKELYHYTSETNFDRIFDSNILNPSQKYGNLLSFTSDSEYHKKEHGLDYGKINVRITFDNEKLISDGYSFSPFDHSSKQNKIGKEFEYIISTPIKNVKNYIKNITIFKGNAIVGEIDKTATDYANKYYLNSDIRYANGGQLNEEAQQLIDIIDINPSNERYAKYKSVLKEKYNIDYVEPSVRYKKENDLLEKYFGIKKVKTNKGLDISIHLFKTPNLDKSITLDVFDDSLNNIASAGVGIDLQSKTIRVGGVMVKDNMQRKGVYSSMMNEIEKISKENNLKMQETGRSQDAQNFWKSRNNPDIRYADGGELIKRADGHYSKRGLWDNIRDNKGSGRKPTKEMLEQEAKIKNEMADGGNVKYLKGNKLKIFKILQNNYLTKEEAEENKENYSQLNIWEEGDLTDMVDVKALDNEGYFDIDVFEKQISEIILKYKLVDKIELEYGDYEGANTEWFTLYELKGRYADGGNVENKETYNKWKSLVNMSKGELEKFYNSQEGKDAGLSSKEASEQGISSGRESARWVMKMKQTPMQEWTPTMWEWAKKQISFVSRMSGNKGGLYDDKGNKTRKHTSLLIWGHNPEKYEDGANIEKSEWLIDGKEATFEDFKEIYQRQMSSHAFDLNPKKVEYFGSDEQGIRAFEDYKRKASIYNRKGEFKESYMKAIIRKAFGELSFVKFGKAFRKHIDTTFKPESHELKKMKWSELAGYIIGDANYLVTENQFRDFANELGIIIPGNIDKKEVEHIENKKTNTMDKAIEVSTSEYKFSEFYEWFKNYIPSSLYEESWASEMRRLNSLILDNNVEEKITFTDSRLVLISFMALNQSDVTKGGMREWWIVRRYLEQYSDNNSVQGTDLFEFVDKYIGYTFTDATMNEETLGRVETLKLVLSKHIKDDSIMIPYFVKHEIMSNIKEDVVEKIIEEKAPEEEIEEVSVEKKWQGLKDFAEMMMEDAEGEVLEKWQGLYDFCELMLEK